MLPAASAPSAARTIKKKTESTTRKEIRQALLEGWRARDTSEGREKIQGAFNMAYHLIGDKDKKIAELEAEKKRMEEMHKEAEATWALEKIELQRAARPSFDMEARAKTIQWVNAMRSKDSYWKTLSYRQCHYDNVDFGSCGVLEGVQYIDERGELRTVIGMKRDCNTFCNIWSVSSNVVGKEVWNMGVKPMRCIIPYITSRIVRN